MKIESKELKWYLCYPCKVKYKRCSHTLNVHAANGIAQGTHLHYAFSTAPNRLWTITKRKASHLEQKLNKRKPDFSVSYIYNYSKELYYLKFLQEQKLC